MVHRLALAAWQIRQQFFRYFLIGGSGVFLDVGSFWLLTNVFHLTPVVSVMINQPALLAYVFFLNKHWSFKNKELPHYQLVRFLTLAGANYVIAILFMRVGHDVLGFHELWVRIVNIAAGVSWNFFLYKYWVYRPTPKLFTPGRGPS